MEDLLPVLGMVFSLLVLLLIAGTILVYPLTRRLGALLEIRMEERRASLEGRPSPDELETLRRAMESVQAEVARLAERQQFTDRLLERGQREAPPLGPGRSREGGSGSG